MEWEKIGKKCVKEALGALSAIKGIKLLDDGINPHTDADLVSHNAIVSELQKSGIACDLVSEEFGQKIHINGGSGAVNVFIDPIDGTAFFMRDEFSFCAVGMFVVEKGQPVYSFVGDIATGDIFHCDRYHSYKNDIRVKNPAVTIGKQVLVGWAPYSPRMEKFFEKFSKLPQREYLMFNHGQMLQSARMTGGSCDSCFEILPAKLQEFAGAIIAWRAGGELTTMEGDPIVWDGNVKQTMLVSRDRELHHKLLTLFNTQKI